MPSVKTYEMSRFIAEQIIESVSEVSFSSLYISVGKPDSWANDAVGDTPVDTVDEHLGIWNNMHFAKRVSGNDLSLICRRINWTSNTVYDAYTHSANLSGLNYYVLTSNFSVYKCLENNRGAASTIEPTYTSVSTTNRTADGYLWKYMYTLTRAQRLKFLTNDWMPVRELTLNDGSPQWGVQTFAIDGSIEAIKVLTTGNGYAVPGVTTNVTIGGDGTGARANIVANTITNTVMYISVTSKGSDYTWANCTLTSSNSQIANSATASVAISPFDGHGAHPPSELDVSGLMVNIRLKGTENGLVKVDNDFRQVAIIRDPVLRADGNNASNTVINQTFSVTLAGSGGPFVLDEWVYQGSSLSAATFKGKIIWYESNQMQLTNTSGTIRSTTLLGATSSATRYVAEYGNILLQRRSGKILYIDNRVPITRSSSQTENLQIPIIF